jgi:thiamine transport system permease protein
MTSRLSNLRYVLYAAPLVFLAWFFFYPLANILVTTVTAGALTELISRPYYLQVIGFTVYQATLSTLLTLIAGLPAAYLFARYDFPAKGLLRALVTVPFVLPTVVVATAFRALLGPDGPVNTWLVALFGLDGPIVEVRQTLAVILLAHVYYNIAVIIRLVGGFWANLNPRLGEVASILGANPARVFLDVTLPLLRPAIVSAAGLIYLFTFTSFGVILLLGGPSFSTIETEIYRQYTSYLRPDVAGLLSMIQIAFTFGLMWLYGRWQRMAAVPIDFRPRREALLRPTSLRQKAAIATLVVGLAVFVLSPLASLVWRSFVDRFGNLTLANYAALPVLRRGSVTFVPPLAAIRNSLVYALLTTVSAGVLGLISAAMLTSTRRWRGLLDPLLMLPLGASAVTLGFGYVLTLQNLRTSPVLVLIAHTLVALPFAVRSLLPVLQGIKPHLREAAAMLGASPLRVWREVDLPIVSRALIVALVFAFTISMGEFGATSFIIRPTSGYLTIPVAIQRYLGQPGALNFGQALAMSTILMAVCITGFVAIERFRYADIGEF